MDLGTLACWVFVVVTVLGMGMEGFAAYRAHRRHQWARRYVKQLRTTGLRRPTRKA
ncbi:hypothetical protein UFOVP464_26 [uncultured Caudovirales phage]|uniref:Uncharacterized protein n=1 Tax=uncultured Caudovirales phage TaxID=2100421 RepID=A0A6J5MGK1_9CAUD|nr:hypothetical protein UFOVP464_26 [uncultured Caudovirales phage]CAB4189203.1 hypothetical protein UFOVP1189_2 [uncultured Caudovirales phage]